MSEIIKTKLLSIIIASNRPHNMRAFLDNIHKTISNPVSLEILVKIDDGDEAMRQLLEDAIEHYPFEIRFIQTPKLDGYYSLHYAYQELFELSDVNTYFILPMNEEIRFCTSGWDETLRSYVGFFADDIFRLKISVNKYRNYYTYHECGPNPENYPILSRKWVTLAEGIGDCWGPDGWHQFIDYHLGIMFGLNNLPGLFRSIPLADIEIKGEETGRELTIQQSRERERRVHLEWWRMYSPKVQQNIRRLAVKMWAHIWAYDNNISQPNVIENKKACYFEIYHKNGVDKSQFHYFLSPFYIRYMNFCYLIGSIRRKNFEAVNTYMLLNNASNPALFRYVNKLLRRILVMFAYTICFISSDFYSTEKMTFKTIIRNFIIFNKKIIKKMLGQYLSNQIRKIVKKV